MKPVRLQLSRRKGFNLQAVSIATNWLPAVNVARPSKFGNPFIVGRDGNAAYCVSLFAQMLIGNFSLCATPSVAEQEAARAGILASRDELRGKNLACWCKPGAPCHAGILLKLGENAGARSKFSCLPSS